jgi:DNA topoisomerase-2
MKNPQTKLDETTYEKKSLIEHVLLRPDSYVGSIEPISSKMWVYAKDTNCIV